MVRISIGGVESDLVVDLLTAGEGGGPGHEQNPAAVRSAYSAERTFEDGLWSVREIDLHDPVSGLTTTTRLRTIPGLDVVRAETTVRNDGDAPVVLEAVSSLVIGGLSIADFEVHWADNDWLAEGRWRSRPVREVLPDVNTSAHGNTTPRGRFTVAAHGTWSSGGHLPMGALTGPRTLLWQIEHNGPWRWQLRERPDGLHVALSGPTDLDHQWRLPLEPGQEFTSVPVAVASSDQGLEDAAALLTRYRRLLRRPHQDHARLPVIFNDYMNTIMGDPTTEKLLPIDAAASVGAEYFVIDAGWYGDDPDWWPSVGAWRPSTRRFPGGLAEVTDRIRDRGMTVGLWLEPEVVGVDSPIARELPDDAFFQRSGVRVAEARRYQLDFRHPAARAHLDETVDRLIRDFGVGYFKLDYNVTPGSGTEVGGNGAGARRAPDCTGTTVPTSTGSTRSSTGIPDSSSRAAPPAVCAPTTRCSPARSCIRRATSRIR
jgi:alpha-galactosidase